MSGSLINYLLTVQNQIKIYHWYTTSYARHKATDMCLESLMPLIDKFVETYIGKYGRRKLENKSEKRIKLTNLNDEGIEKFIKGVIQELIENVEKWISMKEDPDMVTLRDEMVQVLRQTLYLFYFTVIFRDREYMYRASRTRNVTLKITKNVYMRPSLFVQPESLAEIMD
jgi:hypothetical protein